MFYNITGYYVAYIALIVKAKEEMRSFIENSEDYSQMTRLVFHFENGDIKDKDFSFMDEDEFEYKGNMYDVVKSEIKDGFIYFYCINDKAEETINQALQKHIQDNFSTDSPSQKNMSAIFKNVLKKCISNFNFQELKISGEETLAVDLGILSLPDIICDISPPPPKFI